jgi:hypothetical protein
MSEHEGQKKAPNTSDFNSEEGPTEKLHEHEMFEADTLVPGTQKLESEEIKDEKGPNTE